MASDTLTAKLVTMCLLGGVSLFLGLIPIKISKVLSWDSNSPRSQLWLTILTCFGAGVILTTTVTHMMPEVSHFIRYNIEHGIQEDTGLPLAEILVLLGFFMIYIVEEVVHHGMDWYYGKYLSKANNTNGAPGSEECNKGNEHKECEGMIVDMVAAENENSFQVALRGFLVILALSLHAIFEGMAVGLTQKASYVWYLFFAIAAHKFVISFCIGIQFVSSGLRPLFIVLYQSTFSLFSPIGIAIGIALTETVSREEEVQGPEVIALQGLATGTLLYVVFFELLEKERQKKGVNSLIQVTFVVLGFLTMIMVQLIENYTTGATAVTGTGVGTPPLPCLVDAESLPAGKFNLTCVDGAMTVMQ